MSGIIDWAEAVLGTPEWEAMWVGRVKQAITDLVNRVADDGERIVLTSRGKPKAAIVSVEDYVRLEQAKSEQALARWEDRLGESEQFNAAMLARRHGRPFDVDALWEATRADLEKRDNRTVGSWPQLCLSLDPARPATGSVSIAGDPMAAGQTRVGSAGPLALPDDVSLLFRHLAPGRLTGPAYEYARLLD